MIQNEKQVEINGTEYIVKVHPGEAGIKTAFEVQRLIGSSAYESKEMLQKALDSLPDDVRDSIHAEDENGNRPSEEEAQKRFMEAIMPKIDPLEMMDIAKRFLKNLDSEQMFKLTRMLFAGVSVNGQKLDINAHFMKRYANVVPLMLAVIEFNGFLELDPTDLLRN